MKNLKHSIRHFHAYASMPIKRILRASPTHLEFGCGPRLEPGYTGVDIRFFEGVKFICNAWEIVKYVRPESVVNIRSRHFLEHLTYAQSELALKVWLQLLIPGGQINIIIPDFDYHLKQFSLPPNSPAEFNPTYTNRQHAIAGFYGWQREGQTKVWDVHKSGYSFESLSSLLEKIGYTRIERNKDKPWNLNVTAFKSDGFQPH